MRVLGIDPGTHRVGWGVVEGTPSKQQLIASGCLESPKNTPSEIYLPKLHHKLLELIKKHDPQVLGIETLLFQKNVKTAISVAQARGVILLTAAEHGLPIVELAPNTIKSAIAGHGGAGKKEVSRMVGLLLNIKLEGRLDDELDALATAMTTIITNQHLDFSN